MGWAGLRVGPIYGSPQTRETIDCQSQRQRRGVNNGQGVSYK